MSLRIHVLGAGAIGGLFAARLSRTADICLLSRTVPDSSAKPFQALVLQGSDLPGTTELVHPGTTGLVHPSITGLVHVELPCESVSGTTPIDHLFLTTKSYDAVAALDSVRHRLTSHSQIYLFQNGLGSQVTLLQRYPELCFWGATTTEGANRPDRHHIVHAGRGQTLIGPIKQNSTRDINDILTALREAGFDTEYSTDIWRHLWRKLTVNCGINPYTALLNCLNGEILTKPLFSSTIDPLTVELETIMGAAGFPENRESIRQRIIDVATATAENISSMLQDVRHNKSTEILAINGFICEFAKQHRLDCRVNESLTQQVLALHPES